MQAFIISNFLPLSGTISNNPDTFVVTPEKSIGIDEVKTIAHFLSRKPMGDKNRVYLKDAHLMTVYAQNALLKILEEPPGASEIYLVTDQPDTLLPTVLSRVQITFTPRSPDTHRDEVGPISPIGFDLDTLTTREQALDFLDGVEYYLHQNLTPLISNLYYPVSNTRKYLKANVNLKLCLNYFSMNLLL